MKKCCVYTALFGEYEVLNELQGEALTSPIDKICVTDNPRLKSDSWEIRVVSPDFPLDSFRSQRAVKILPHKFLPDYSSSVYIDNSVRITVDPLKIFSDLLGDNTLVLANHSFRENLYEEFHTVIASGLDDAARVFEQLNHYLITAPQILDMKPFWGGLILREHMNSGVIKIMENWYGHVLRYSRRDQLSLPYSTATAEAPVKVIDIDNHKSPYHEWPIFNQRKTSKRNWSPDLSGALDFAMKMRELKKLESNLDARISALDNLNNHLVDCFTLSELPKDFDPKIYLTLNKDVSDAGADPVQHFLAYGLKEGRRYK